MDVTIKQSTWNPVVIMSKEEVMHEYTKVQNLVDDALMYIDAYAYMTEDASETSSTEEKDGFFTKIGKKIINALNALAKWLNNLIGNRSMEDMNNTEKLDVICKKYPAIKDRVVVLVTEGLLDLSAVESMNDFVNAYSDVDKWADPTKLSFLGQLILKAKTALNSTSLTFSGIGSALLSIPAFYKGIKEFKEMAKEIKNWLSTKLSGTKLAEGFGMFNKLVERTGLKKGQRNSGGEGGGDNSDNSDNNSDNSNDSNSGDNNSSGDSSSNSGEDSSNNSNSGNNGEKHNNDSNDNNSGKPENDNDNNSNNNPKPDNSNKNNNKPNGNNDNSKSSGDSDNSGNSGNNGNKSGNRNNQNNQNKNQNNQNRNSGSKKGNGRKNRNHNNGRNKPYRESVMYESDEEKNGTDDKNPKSMMSELARLVLEFASKVEIYINKKFKMLSRIADKVVSVADAISAKIRKRGSWEKFEKALKNGDEELPEGTKYEDGKVVIDGNSIVNDVMGTKDDDDKDDKSEDNKNGNDSKNDKDDSKNDDSSNDNDNKDNKEGEENES